MRGAVVYHGPSRINGDPIVAILTGMRGDSKNPKTGAMAQLYILPADLDPVAAIRSGEDESVCGMCPHRGETCYVNAGQAPLAIFRAWIRGAYPEVSPRDLPELPPVRLGAYGDPGAMPLRVLRAICERAPSWTGYTHQWRRFPGLRSLCMASADSADEALEAQRRGWRTFGIVAPDSDPMPGTIFCPASPEGGMRAQCVDCGLCAGTSRPAKSISIRVHGKGASAFVRAIGG